MYTLYKGGGRKILKKSTIQEKPSTIFLRLILYIFSFSFH